MNHLPLIIKREYLAKVKNKSFIIMTFLSPLVFIALISVISYLSQMNTNKVRVISVLNESGIMMNHVFKSSKNTRYNILPETSLKGAKKIVKESEGYGLLHIHNFSDAFSFSRHFVFYSGETPSAALLSNIENKIQIELTRQNRIKEGIDEEKIKASVVNVNIRQERFDGKKTSKVDRTVKLVFGIAAGYLLFMFIIIYGNMIMRSIIEEKTSRIIEVIISSVKPIQLMLGKIIGTSLAGITQFIIWIVLGSFLIAVASLIFNIDVTQTPQQQMMQHTVENPEVNIQIKNIVDALFNLPLTNLILAFILFFISGYLLYSSLYATIGAAVDNETDTQQFIFPIIMPLILAVYVGIFTVIEDPHGPISIIFSFIPLTSPVVMLMRIPFGVSIWQQLLSLLLLITTFIVTIWFAAKIYRVGILMYGKKPSYRELIKWIKY